VNDVVAQVQREDGSMQEIKLAQRWPIRTPRPVAKKMVPTIPLVTGQRVIDTFFPITKGGTAAIPGPFGSGKSVAQQQLAKWSDADIIVYIGCGERGNEMTDVLLEFPELEDPKTGESLMKRTILIANTSNMPVAAREASVYTGITIAEYFRDMGYSVALMADSTSRWAEALREMSGRLEEMPGDEGYPAYLGSRTAQFYERGGIAQVLGSPSRVGSLTAIGAVSPPGGDLSEPVTQNTLSVVKVFWGLEERLAYRRHYPAINWLTSYSLYLDQLAGYFAKEAGADWNDLRAEAMSILQQEASLEEIVRLVGLEALSKQEQLLLHIARMIREDYLQQNAYDPIDTYTSLHKQHRMMKLIVGLFKQAGEHLKNVDYKMQSFLALDILPAIARAKSIPEDKVDAEFAKLEAMITANVESLTNE
jgi:V/A-type H+-transporting ATPase subunit A